MAVSADRVGTSQERRPERGDRVGSLGTGQVLEQIQPAFPRADQVDVAVAVDVAGGDLWSRAGRAAGKIDLRISLGPVLGGVSRRLAFVDHLLGPAARAAVVAVRVD